MSDEADGPVDDGEGEEPSSDWFEQALRELAAEEGVEVPDDVDLSDLEAATDGEEAGVTEDGGTGREPGGDAGPAGDDTEPTGGDTEPSGSDTEPSGGDTEPFGDRGGSQDGLGRRDAGGRQEFGGRGSGGHEFGAGGGGQEFGAGGSQEFGAGGTQEFGEVGGEDEFGFADLGGEEEFGFGGGTDFEDVEFESDIDRVDIGIEGLDEMILGGVPERSLIVTIGAAGTGKTTFALQFLHEALRTDGKAIYITLEESRDAILSTAEEKGWPFREFDEAGRLAVVGLDPIEMANSLNSIRNDLSRLVSDFGADRLVLDSVSLLEMMYDHPARRRSEVFDFARSLKNAGVTTMLTSEASEDSPYASRYGIVEYLVDAVFVLQYVRPSDFRETRLAVEIQKIRDANHSRETKPYEITSEGISVYRQANIF